MIEKVKILVIDDEPVICIACEKALKQDEMEIDCAENGIIGLAKLHDKKYDIVLIDLMMPQIKGMNILESIRKYNQEIITIVITGYATHETAEEALQKGAFDYLAKPFTTQELRSVVYRAIQTRREKTIKLTAEMQ